MKPNGGGCQGPHPRDLLWTWGCQWQLLSKLERAHGPATPRGLCPVTPSREPRDSDMEEHGLSSWHSGRLRPEDGIGRQCHSLSPGEGGIFSPQPSVPDPPQSFSYQAGGLASWRPGHGMHCNLALPGWGVCVCVSVWATPMEHPQQSQEPAAAAPVGTSKPRGTGTALPGFQHQALTRRATSGHWA